MAQARAEALMLCGPNRTRVGSVAKFTELEDLNNDTAEKFKCREFDDPTHDMVHQWMSTGIDAWPADALQERYVRMKQLGRAKQRRRRESRLRRPVTIMSRWTAVLTGW